jgi:hypothetical protein
MTTASLAAQGGSAISQFFSKVAVFLEAFFDEAHAANVRTNAEQPFGL